MNEKEVRRLLLQRLHLELLVFKDSLLLKSREEIFTSCHKIGVYVRLFGIFIRYIGDMEEDTARNLLNLKYGILESFYLEWMEKKDGSEDGLNTYVSDRLELISEMGRKDNTSGEEDYDGTGYDQAA